MIGRLLCCGVLALGIPVVGVLAQQQGEPTPALNEADVRDVGSVEAASEANRQIYDETRDEAEFWLEGKVKAGEAVNRDDALLQGVIDARQAAKALADDPLFDEAKNQEGMDAFLQEARQIQSDTSQPMAKLVDEMVGSDPTIQAILKAGMDAQGDEPEAPRYILAVTRALGDATIKNIIDIARDHPDMVVVFRGLLPGEKVEDMMRYLMSLLPPVTEDSVMPNVMIDPTLFSGVGITVAPTLLRLDDEGAVLAQVRGVVNPEWIEEAVANDRIGDLGKLGETTEIAEEDLIEVMKRQLAAAGAEDRAKQMADNFWHVQKMVDLPTATVARTRIVDPTVVVTDGIYGPDGTVIALPGQRLNPFDAIPFNAHVVVFDARDPLQVSWARAKVVELEGKEVVLVMSEIDRDKGWDGYNAAVGEIGRHIYMLPPEMVERFQLEHVPSTVEGGDRVLIVKEYALQADGSEEPAPAVGTKG